MITACIVLLPGMEPEFKCFLQALAKTSTKVSRVLVAIRTKELIEVREKYEHIEIEKFPFWFEKGPTPAGNVQWKGRGYSHAVGLHHCLKKVTTEYVLFTEPDVVFLKEGFDALFIDAMQKHELSIIGVTRAADPRGQELFKQQAIGDFPTVIACMTRTAELPHDSYLGGHLKMRPHAFPQANTEEEFYERLDGIWLLQSAIPKYMSVFPNPEGEYPVGCNLYLWFAGQRYLSFHMKETPKPNQFYNATTFNLNNFGLKSDYFGEEPLLFHAGHGGIEALKKVVDKTVNIEYIQNLNHVLTTILVRNWPHRSPYIFTEVVKDIIKNKKVCDVGCAEGDQLALFSKYAAEVVGIELNISRAQPALDRGFKVLIGNYKEMGIPEADVYFSWIGAVEDAQFVADLAATGRKATSLLFCRKGNHVKDIVEKWGGRLLEFDYREPHSDIPGFAKEGKGWAGIIELN